MKSHFLNKYLNFKTILLVYSAYVILSCKKEKILVENNQSLNTTISQKFTIAKLDSISEINKTTSWYNTNRSFTRLFSVNESLYWGFEQTQTGLIPYNTGTTSSWSSSKNYFWNDLGTYLYTDLTGDGKKDLYAYYWKNPFPTNAKGLNLFSEYEKQPNVYDLQVGLTQVRKCVLADINNDKQNEIILFSSGYDAMPFPGDSIGIFYPKRKHYQYLSKDIGYFHGGATGDINNDGLTDIVAYSGGSAVIPTHPIALLNNGNETFTLSNQVFNGFDRSDNYYTVELFDLNKDEKLDLLLGSRDVFRIILQEKGIFDRSKAINIIVNPGLELMDIAFFDFNYDGAMDILTMSNKDGYNGYGLRLYLYNGNSSYTEATSTYFDSYSEVGPNSWIKWIHLFDIDNDNDFDIVADGLFGGLSKQLIYWKNENGKFIRTIQNR
jgi:hypothetical protein